MNAIRNRLLPHKGGIKEPLCWALAGCLDARLAAHLLMICSALPVRVTETSQPTPSHSLPALSLAALGVVFGDIGTSPLYALKAVLDVTKENPPTEILGALSLIVWTLIIITSVKYITLAVATTVLLSVAMREIWEWPLPAVIGIGLGFATIDGGFLSANMTKLAEGGWVPLLLGALIFSVMLF
jgi:K+ transporter